MSKPAFMSAEHVALMNERLAVDRPSQLACQSLPRTFQIAYQLEDGAATVWWSLSFVPGQGARFHLAPPQGAADMLFSGSYWDMLDFMRRFKAGEAAAEDMPLTTSGDPQAYDIFGEAFSAARAAAMMDTEIPLRDR